VRLGREEHLLAIVTGASSGIGRAVASALAARGVHVVLVSRNQKALEILAEEIEQSGGAATVAVTDVRNREEIQRLVRNTVTRFEKIDICVCNAGAYLRGRVSDISTAELESSMAVNFYGSASLVLEVLPFMLRRRKGHLVAITSVDGKKGLPLDAPYVAAKSALTGFMEVLRQELHGTGVRASVILPGRVDTPMIEDLEFPWISRKIASTRVARAVMQAVERDRAEVLIPYLGPKSLLLASAFSARLGDWLVRIFRLEGEKKSA
jgi:short-subunit dehydrogenase